MATIAGPLRQGTQTEFPDAPEEPRARIQWLLGAIKAASSGQEVDRLNSELKRTIEALTHASAPAAVPQ